MTKRDLTVAGLASGLTLALTMVALVAHALASGPTYWGDTHNAHYVDAGACVAAGNATCTRVQPLLPVRRHG